MPNGMEVYLLSGYNAVTLAGASFSSNISGQPVYLVNDSINNVVKISGSVIVVSDGAGNNANMKILDVSDGAGNKVYLNVFSPMVSGFNTVEAKISGQVANVSGQAISISGQTVRIAAGASTLAAIAIANDINAATSSQLQTGAFLLAYHEANNTFARVRVTTPVSGEGYRLLVATSGQPTNISGQSVYFVNDGVNNVAIVSGQQIRISGQSVSIMASATNLTAFSPGTDVLGTGNSALHVQAVMYGYESAANTWARLRVTASGDGFRLIVSVSGQPIRITDGNGAFQALAFNNDGAAIGVVGAVGVSWAYALNTANSTGDRLRMTPSTDGSRLMVTISGQPVMISGQQTGVPTAVATAAAVQLTSLSGGAALGSLAIRAVTMNNRASNNSVYVGGTGSNAPASGIGFELEAGRAVRQEVDNLSDVRVFATVSGQFVTYMAEIP